MQKNLKELEKRVKNIEKKEKDEERDTEKQEREIDDKVEKRLRRVEKWVENWGKGGKEKECFDKRVRGEREQKKKGRERNYKIDRSVVKSGRNKV